MAKTIKTLFFTMLISGVSLSALSQPDDPPITPVGQTQINALQTAVPFMRVSPDARSGAMGDVGLAISPDANSVFWNSAKLPFAESPLGVTLSYTPWLAALDLNDIYLVNAGAYYKLDDVQAISAMVKYFSLGELTIRNSVGEKLQVDNPQEFAIQGGYSRALSDAMGIGVNLKWIHSNLTKGNAGVIGEVTSGNSIAGDLNWYFDPVEAGNLDMSYGASISNIGSKISYTDNTGQEDFLPTNLGLGAAAGFDVGNLSKLNLSLDFNKLLVPTPESQVDESFKEKSVLSGMFGSFGDAPDGFSEEIKEFQISIGGEYDYNDQFFARAGYFHEDDTKGGRQYATLGAGVKYNVANFNFAYLLATNGSQSPLDKTLRFSLDFNLE